MKLKEALTEIYLPSTIKLSVKELCARLELATVVPSNSPLADIKLEGICDERYPMPTRLFTAAPGMLKASADNKGGGIATKVAACLISAKDEQAMELSNRLDLENKTCFIVSSEKTFTRNRITAMQLFNAKMQASSIFLNPAQHSDRLCYERALQSNEIVCENIDSMQIGLNVVCGKNVCFEAGVRLLGNNTIGDHCKLGRAVVLHPGVVLAPGTIIGDASVVHSGTVIGSDGFGYEAIDENLPSDALSKESRVKLVKIPQLGRVLIGSDVEIGANVAIDRATLSATVIGNGVKIDNLVQIAHNVEIGDDCIIVSQVGIAGSSKLGKGVTLAGQVGVADHCDIGDGVKVGAQSGIASGKKIANGSILFGSPAIDFRIRMRIEAAMRALVKK